MVSSASGYLYQPVFPLVFLVGDSDCSWNPVELARAANDGDPAAQAALARTGQPCPSVKQVQDGSGRSYEELLGFIRN
jgi:hypothetical protein